MRVLVDAHMLGHRETGNETYTRGLLEGLSSIEGITVAAAVEPGYADDVRSPGAITWLTLPSRSSWRRIASHLGALATSWRADVVHATYIAPLASPCPAVVSVHDVSFRRYPEYFSWRDRLLFGALLGRSMKRAAGVLTLSTHARDELRHFYPSVATPIHVVPAAPGAGFRSIDTETVSAALRRHGLTRPYLLAVGNLQPRKNLIRLIEAYAALGDRRAAVDLAIVGPSGFQSSNVADRIASLGLAESVKLLGYVTEDDLVALYNGAIALVYASVYEGFGLPVIEAMACGLPVIAANTSSLPEVAGDAALLVDPFSTEALRDAMARLIAAPDLRADLRDRGRARAGQFSWRRTAEAAAATYRAVTASARA